MKISGSTVLVTGANRGLGRHFAEQLVARGATVYAGARNLESVTVPGVIPVRLDVTDPESIAAAAKAASGVSIVINNAGSFTGASVTDGSMDDVRLEMETHYFGPLEVARAFAPQLAKNGGGAILNVLSVLSWLTYPGFSAYSAAKSAAWSLTSALRNEYSAQGTQVTALHVGFMNTDMVGHIEASKHEPGDIAKLGIDAIEDGAAEVMDEQSRLTQGNLAGGVAALYASIG
ncbi:SDR family oxidoreductase [Streptomyces sp. NPDC060205]|uniref:SDR family oxidoreductase n=1 Tax=Streptomyces sp. NPDC060205 TaxID=3347072 RepID=UPI0036463EF3